MDPAIIPFDPVRMLFGTAPIGYYLEIIVRSSVVYAWTLAMLRLIGGRTIAQLSLVEFLLVIALGSAVGDAMFFPDVPLFHALLVVTFIVLLSRWLDQLTARFIVVQDAVDGQPVVVVADGRLLPEGMANRSFSAAEMRAQLRLQGVENLGTVRAAYVEPAGQLSVFPADTPRPGLRIEPPPEIDPPAPFAPAPDQIACCTQCGALAGPQPPETCAACGAAEWTGAELAQALPDTGKAGK